jgi:hypothetical protein
MPPLPPLHLHKAAPHRPRRAPSAPQRSFDAYDGGFTDPLPCPPKGVTYCVRVQAQPFGAPASGVTRGALEQFQTLARLSANGTGGGAPAARRAWALPGPRLQHVLAAQRQLADTRAP